jgi:DHA3 family macrolide efflux protein-like MFS transporter
MIYTILPRGMRIFIIIWLGQLVSLVGSGLTSFALGLWVYERTGSVTQFALISLFAVVPGVVLSPLAGALADRWDRRWVMILSDTGAGLSTLMMALLFFAGQVQVWHICLAVGASATFGAFQYPAYAASITLLVSKRNLGRANGMVQFGQAASEILAPALAGILVLTVQVQGVLLIDFVTFIFAVTTLLLVRLPKPEATAASQIGQGSLLREAVYGWTYIAAQRGLLGLLVFFAVVNFLWGILGVTITPMILGFASADVLGVIISVAGGGMLVGGLVMSAWGGPSRRINNVIVFELLSGLCFMLIGLRPLAWLVALGAFCAHVTIAIVYGSNQAIWQSKVPPGVQGRVLAVQRMIATSTRPMAYLVAGPLADKVFEPLVAPAGPLAGSIGQIIGIGPGRGIGLLFLIMGVLKVATSLGSYLYSPIRQVEDELPDVLISQSLPLPQGGVEISNV